MSGSDRERLPKLFTTFNEFVKKFDVLPRGESFIYYLGYLSVDRVHNSELDLISKFVSELQEKGKVELTQKKVGHGIWEYIVRKREKERRL